MDSKDGEQKGVKKQLRVRGEVVGGEGVRGQKGGEQKGGQQKVGLEEPPTKRRRRAGKAEESSEPPLVIRCKTVFKKHLIQKCIKFEDRRDPEDDKSPDVIAKYFLRYDIDSGEMFVGGIRVDVDEERKCLVCSACSKAMGEQTLDKKPLALWQMARDMKLHIIGRHLEGFTCLHCDEPYGFHTRGSTHYYRHIGLFHREKMMAEEEETQLALELANRDQANSQ